MTDSASTAINDQGGETVIEPEHLHCWAFVRTDEDWFDGDEVDVYKCAVVGCGATDKRYIPR